jgi:hypothetical protein
MRQERFKFSRTGSTVLTLPLLVVLIAPPIFAEVAHSDDISIDSAKWQAQQEWSGYGNHTSVVGQTRSLRAIIAQAAVSTPVPSVPYQPPQRHIVRGAGRGAALGAVGGAIAGDPAKGAAAGAAMGGAAGVFRRRDERRQQSMQPQQMPQQQPPQQQMPQQ